MTLRPTIAYTSVFAFAVSACGGGSGSGSGTVGSTPPPVTQVSLPNPLPAPTTKPTSENFDTTEYRNSSAAIGANAIGAWQHGATGEGITIGFVDTGLVQSLSDFDGRIHPSSRDVLGDRPMGDVWGHGTAVAGIAAAAHDGAGMEGIAFDATIFMAKADQGCPDSCSFPSDAVVRGIDAARVAGAKVINLSVGGGINDEILAAAKRAVDAGIILVIGAGNSGSSSPNELARELGKLAPDRVIIVGALGVSNPDGSINYDLPAQWTTAAGGSQAYFLTAPGWLNSATYFRGGGIDKLSGTSFAAPVVSGAIALLAQAFPMLTPQQMVLLLYMTADDLGAAGTDATFGRGRLNIGRAFQPVGTARLASTMEAIPSSVGSLPGAAGDAARRGKLKATILDDFKRPFDVNLAATMIEITDAGPLYQHLMGGDQIHTSANLGPVALAFTVDGAKSQRDSFGSLRLSPDQDRSARLLAATAIAKLSNSLTIALGVGTHSPQLREGLTRFGPDFMLSEQATQQSGFFALQPTSMVLQQQLSDWRFSISAERGSIAALQPRGPIADYSMVGIHITRSFSRGELRAGVSRLIEPQTLLGGRLHDLFGKRGSRTWFADFDANLSIGNAWLLSASARRGWSALSSGHFTTRSLSFDVTREGVFSDEDVLKVRLMQQLRIERGSIGVVLPSSWDYKTETFTEAFRQLNLSPSGREQFFELGYFRRMPNGSINMHVYHRADPGHVDGTANDIGGGVRARFRL